MKKIFLFLGGMLILNLVMAFIYTGYFSKIDNGAYVFDSEEFIEAFTMFSVATAPVLFWGFYTGIKKYTENKNSNKSE